jgi:hypothetical protein
MDFSIFKDIAKYAENDFWKEFFLKMSTGVLPKGVFLTNNCISIFSHDQAFQVSIINRHYIYDIYKQCVYLLKSKLYIYPSEFAYNAKNNILIDESVTWASLKKKCIKRLFIEHFVIEMSELYNLNTSQMKSLFSDIMLRIYLKIINKTDIEYCSTNLRIINIHPFKFDHQTYYIDTTAVDGIS